MPDIQNRSDVEQLVDAFYEQVIQDEVIGDFFTRIVELDWDMHIPVMYDFWESMLFGTAKYKGNAMLKHFALHERKPLEEKHFERWLSLWENAVRSHFEGERANQAVERARQIGGLMQFKLLEQSDSGIV